MSGSEEILHSSNEVMTSSFAEGFVRIKGEESFFISIGEGMEHRVLLQLSMMLGGKRLSRLEEKWSGLLV